MSRFNNDNRDRGFRNNNFRQRGGGEQRELFVAVCDECGRNCKVPFKPTSGKPVYCSDCFEGMGGNERSDRNSSYGRKYGNDDNNRRDSYSPRVNSTPANNNPREMRELTSKVDLLSEKLDRITSQLNTILAASKKPSAKKAVKAKAKVEKVEKKKVVKKAKKAKSE